MILLRLNWYIVVFMNSRLRTPNLGISGRPRALLCLHDQSIFLWALLTRSSFGLLRCRVGILFTQPAQLIARNQKTIYILVFFCIGLSYLINMIYNIIILSFNFILFSPNKYELYFSHYFLFELVWFTSPFPSDLFNVRISSTLHAYMNVSYGLISICLDWNSISSEKSRLFPAVVLRIIFLFLFACRSTFLRKKRLWELF